MIEFHTVTQKLVALAVAVPVTYWLTVALGRLLKRRVGVKLGAMYRLFCVAISLYLPLTILGLNYPSGASAPAPESAPATKAMPEPVSTAVPAAVRTEKRPLKPGVPPEPGADDFSTQLKVQKPALVPLFDLQRELAAASILLGAFFAIALIRRYLWESYFHEKRRTEIPKFLQELVALIAFLVACVIVLSGIYGEGRALAGLIAGSGVAAIILGFAMQDLLGNVISGIALEIGKPFKRGDWLIYENQRAEVVEVNWRSTRLCTNDHTYLDVPNSQIVRHTVVNLSYPTKRHAERVTIGIDYKIPPNHVREILKRAAANGLHVLHTPTPKVFVKEFADSAVIYELKFWMERDELFNDIVDSVRTNIWYELNRNNINIPFPVRTVQIERPRHTTQSVPPSLLEALQKQKFFQCLDQAGSDRLLSSAKMLLYGRGEKIIVQGADGNSMFVVVNGEADIHVDRHGDSAYVTTLKSGDYFGEMSLLTGEKRSATVIARNDCELLEIEKAIFAEVLQSNQDLLQKLSEMLAQRRLETEGIAAAGAGPDAGTAKKKEYTANFLARLYSFFEL